MASFLKITCSVEAHFIPEVSSGPARNLWTVHLKKEVGKSSAVFKYFRNINRKENRFIFAILEGRPAGEN